MNRIRQLRDEKKITQVRLSIELEVSQEAISAYEQGRHNPSVKSLIKMREIFHVSIDYILGLSEERCPTLQKSDLQPEEVNMLHIYRHLDAPGKARFFAYIQGYLDASAQKNSI